MKISVVSSLLTLFLPYLRAVAPPNDNCLNAIEIDPRSGSIIKGDTTEATQDPEFFWSPYGACGTTIDTPGIWYKFKNDFAEKTAVTVSTCLNGTDFLTKISVFKAGFPSDIECYDGLFCVGGMYGVLEECGYSAKYTFLAAEPNINYYIFIHGVPEDFDSRTGTGKFEMEVTTASSYFNVIDSDTNRFVAVLNDYFGYADIQSSSSKLNFQAVFSSELDVKSVEVAFDDQPSHCEKSAPYAVFGDKKGNYRGETIQKFLHTVTATPYAQKKCRGSAGTPLVKQFYVNGCDWNPAIYDVNLDTTVGYMYYEGPYTLPCDFNLELVILCGFDIETAHMVLRDENNKVVHERTETKRPYFLFGNYRDKVNSGSLSPGNYTFTPVINGIELSTLPFIVADAACT